MAWSTDRSGANVVLLSVVIVAAWCACSVEAMTPFTSPMPIFGRRQNGSTWEPSLITSGNYIYAFATWVDGIPACERCATDPTIVAISSDMGVTFPVYNQSNTNYMCPCPTPPGEELQFQADLVAVCDEAGIIYATWMIEWEIGFLKSEDHGLTWSNATKVSPPVADSEEDGFDKNWVVVSPDGQYVYVTYNQVYPWVSVSNDSGDTFPIKQQIDDYPTHKWWFAGGAVVDSRGYVYLAYAATPNENEPDYAVSSGSSSTDTDTDTDSSDTDSQSEDNPFDFFNETTLILVYESKDHGVTWSRILVDELTPDRQLCPAYAECGDPHAFLTGSINMAIDKNDTVYIVYNGNHNWTHPGRAWLAKKYADDANFTEGVDFSSAPLGIDAYHATAMVCAGVAGDVRVGWMDNRTGMWNTYYRESLDGGVTWTDSVMLSDTNLPNPAPYELPNGFKFPYGDYGLMVIDPHNNTHAIWGEGSGWYLGGDVYYVRQYQGAPPTTGTTSSSTTSDQPLATTTHDNPDIPTTKAPHPWAIAGPILGIAIVAIAGGAFYALYYRPRIRAKQPVLCFGPRYSTIAEQS